MTDMWAIIAAVMRVLLTGLLVGGLWMVGFLYNALAFAVLLALPVTAILKLVAALRGQLDTAFFKRPLAPDRRKQLLLVALWSAFWVLLLVNLVAAFPLVQLDAQQLREAHIMMGGSTFLLLALGFFPRKTVEPGAAHVVLGLGVLGLVVQALVMFVPARPDDAMKVPPPVAGRWDVLQGGRAPFLNHHHALSGQRYALDIVQTRDGSWMTGKDPVAENFPSWGQPVYAPVDARVVKAVGELDDHVGGQFELMNPAGNQVVLELGPDRFLFMGHLQKGSVTVKAGDEVKCGMVIGKVGSSGNTSAPHLHLQVSDKADVMDPDAKSFPLALQTVTHRKEDTLPDGALLQRGDWWDAPPPCSEAK